MVAKFTHLRILKASHPLRFLACMTLSVCLKTFSFSFLATSFFETLSVKCIYVLSKVHIEAPRLKCLTFEGNPDDIILVNTPLLASVCAFMPWINSNPQELSYENTFDKSFGAMPPLEGLVGRDFFTKVFVYLWVFNLGKIYTIFVYVLFVLIDFIFVFSFPMQVSECRLSHCAHLIGSHLQSPRRN